MEPTASLLSRNVEYSDEINTSLMIKVDVKKKSIGQLRDDSMFLLNDMEIALHDKHIEKYMEKRKYEQAVSECKKWRSFIKTVVGRNINVISIKELDTVRSEYG